MNDICVYFTQTYEKQILHNYCCHIVIHGVYDVNLNLIFCKFNYIDMHIYGFRVDKKIQE